MCRAFIPRTRSSRPAAHGAPWEIRAPSILSEPEDDAHVVGAAARYRSVEGALVAQHGAQARIVSVGAVRLRAKAVDNLFRPMSPRGPGRTEAEDRALVAGAAVARHPVQPRSLLVFEQREPASGKKIGRASCRER